MDNKKILQEILYEARSNRYMLSVVLTNVYSLLDALKERDKELAKIIPLQQRKRMDKIYENVEDIQFEYFSIRPSQFKALCTRYGNDIVIDACGIIDGYIKRTGKGFKNYYVKLKALSEELLKKQEIKEELSDTIKKIRAIDYTTIQDIEMAKQYINATPEYYRNVDKACIYLKDKFNIEAE